jgi:hypothetical protein
MVKGANKLPQEELALLANERKRIRGKEGRFNPVTQKITVDSLGGVGNIVSKKLSLPGDGILALSQKTAQIQQQVADQSQQQVVQETVPQEQFAQLNQILSSILETVNNLYNLEIQRDKESALAAEKKSRRVRESTLEDTSNIAQKASEEFQKIISPFQNILDKIFGFIKFIFLGKAFLQLVEWLKEPSNVEKIQSLGRFLKDFWPLLLALYIRPLRSFIFKLTGNLLRFSGRLASKALGPIFSRIGGVLSRFAGRFGLKGAARVIPGVQTLYGLGLAGVRAFQGDWAGAGLAAGSALPGAAGWGFFAADVGRSMSGFAGGGFVTGTKGIDKVPAMLTEGEVVINKETVNAIGAEVFLALNKLYGGPDANKPKMMRFNTGGLVGKQDSLINQKSLYIYNRLISGGLTPIAAMGIVSNIGVETGYTYDPSTQQREGPGRGLVQWEQGGRYDTDNINLVSFAESMRKPWNDLNTQIDFILHELNTHPEYREVKNILNTAKTVQEATEAFLMRYEKDGVAHLDRRYAVAEELQNKIWGQKQQTTSEKSKPTQKPYGPGGDPKGTGLGQEQQTTSEKSKPTQKPYGPGGDPKGTGLGQEQQKSPSIQKKPERWSIDPRGWFGMKDGGLIRDNTGIEIDNSPNASDTQGIAVQPGEYILPKDTVNLLGKNLIDQLVAKTDLDSDVSKSISKPKVNRYTPSPLKKSGTGSMMTLPPQIMSAGQQYSSGGGGSVAPVMTAESPNGSEVRSINASIYGIG